MCRILDTRLYKSMAKVEQITPFARLKGATAQTTRDFKSVTSGFTADSRIKDAFNIHSRVRRYFKGRSNRGSGIFKTLSGYYRH